MLAAKPDELSLIPQDTHDGEREPTPTHPTAYNVHVQPQQMNE